MGSAYDWSDYEDDLAKEAEVPVTDTDPLDARRPSTLTAGANDRVPVTDTDDRLQRLARWLDDFGHQGDAILVRDVAVQLATARTEVEEWKLRYIEATNPGINMDEVRHSRLAGTTEPADAEGMSR